MMITNYFVCPSDKTVSSSLASKLYCLLISDKHLSIRDFEETRSLDESLEAGETRSLEAGDRTEAARAGEKAEAARFSQETLHERGSLASFGSGATTDSDSRPDKVG